MSKKGKRWEIEGNMGTTPLDTMKLLKALLKFYGHL